MPHAQNQVADRGMGTRGTAVYRIDGLRPPDSAFFLLPFPLVVRVYSPRKACMPAEDRGCFLPRRRFDEPIYGLTRFGTQRCAGEREPVKRGVALKVLRSRNSGLREHELVNFASGPRIGASSKPPVFFSAAILEPRSGSTQPDLDGVRTERRHWLFRLIDDGATDKDLAAVAARVSIVAHDQS
jgi:hypothetical protein